MKESERIDRLLGQWASEFPELDTTVMGLVTRLQRVAQLIDGRIDVVAVEYGVNRSEADILYTLRRAGTPYRLSPSQLAESLLVTTGTMTGRLDRLEKRGYILRIPNPDDRRSLLIELTSTARQLIDESLDRHIRNEQDMLAPLTPRDRRDLTRMTNKLIDHLAGNRAGKQAQ